MGAMARCHETSRVQILAERGSNQEPLKAPTSDADVDGVLEMLPCSLQALPIHVLSDILSKVRDAKDLANCMAASTTMRDAVQQVSSLDLTCRKRYYDLARSRFPIRPCSFSDSDPNSDSNSDSDSDGETDSDDSRDDNNEGEEEEEDDEEDDESCEWSSPVAPSPDERVDAASPSRTAAPSKAPPPMPVHVPFKSACLNMLRHVSQVRELRIEVDAEMQGNVFQKEEIHMVDFWLSEPMFVRRWASLCSFSLTSLTVVDYGQQATLRQSPIVRVLSETCKGLRHLELRNMYLDTTDVAPLRALQTLTLRCVKLTDQSLADITAATPALQTLALVSVFNIQDATIASRSLRVLCLGLSTPARTVALHVPRCAKLQLKMACPDALRVHAPALLYLAVCMDMPTHAGGGVIEFDGVRGLRELLFGASHFATLAGLVTSNPGLEKIFLDVPCISLGEGGKFEGVIDPGPRVPVPVPDMGALRACRGLRTMSVGPGMWCCLERLAGGGEWPALLERLIVHMVVTSAHRSAEVLRGVVAAMPALKRLEISVHTDSPVDLDAFWRACREMAAGVEVRCGAWKRSLNFACFSF